MWISLTFVTLNVSMGIVIFFLPAPPLLNGIDYSRAVYDEQGQLLRLTISPDGKYRFILTLSSIHPDLISATLLQEDQYFYWHVGVNPISLFKAGWHTYIDGPRRIGASTITMQVARLRYKIHSKTLLGKI